MFTAIEEALWPMLLAGGVGVLLGAALPALLAGLRRPRPVRARRDVAKPAKAVRKPVEPEVPLAAQLLLVDDSAVARAKLRKLFEAAGYSVQLANDGVEALEKLRAGRYALMITDLEMPRMDGVALVAACVADGRWKRMPILAITGHESLRAKFNECKDICGIHRKPWVDDILLSHVAALLEQRGMKRPVPRAAAAPRERTPA